MITWDFELWEVRNDGSDPKLPREQYPRVQKMKIAFRDERGRFNGATNYRQRNVVAREPVPQRPNLSIVV